MIRGYRGLIFSAIFFIVFFVFFGPLSWHLESTTTTLGALVQVLANQQIPVLSTDEFWQGLSLVFAIIIMMILVLYCTWTLLGYRILQSYDEKLSFSWFWKINLFWLAIFLVYQFIYFLVRLKFSTIDKVLRGSTTGLTVLGIIDVILLAALGYFVCMSYVKHKVTFKIHKTLLRRYCIFVLLFLLVNFLFTLVNGVFFLFLSALVLVYLFDLFWWRLYASSTQ